MPTIRSWRRLGKMSSSYVFPFHYFLLDLRRLIESARNPSGQTLMSCWTRRSSLDGHRRLSRGILRLVGQLQESWRSTGGISVLPLLLRSMSKLHSVWIRKVCRKTACQTTAESDPYRHPRYRLDLSQKNGKRKARSHLRFLGFPQGISTLFVCGVIETHCSLRGSNPDSSGLSGDRRLSERNQLC